MSISRKDLEATALVTLAVVVFFATHEAWNVPLVGDSHRWAAGVIAALGLAACSRGTFGESASTTVLALLGVAAFGLAVAALWTASLTPLSLLVLDIVALWALATGRHALAHPGVRHTARHT